MKTEQEGGGRALWALRHANSAKAVVRACQNYFVSEIHYDQVQLASSVLSAVETGINRERLENKAIEEAIRLAGDEAYVESRATGVYISMNAEFNPKGRSIPSPESQWRSARISAVIGQAAR